MPSVRVHKPNGALFFDFQYKGERRREYTLLPDTPSNRKKLEKILARIEAEIRAGTFLYEAYFPNSKALGRVGAASIAPPHLPQLVSAVTDAPPAVLATPLFKTFATQWVDEHSIEWRR